MAFCVNCGNQIQDNMKFCPSCGTPAVMVPPQYTAPIPPMQEYVQPEVPQYTAPMPPMQEYVQPEVSQYTGPMPPMQEYAQPEIPQYTAPMQPQYIEPEPVQQAYVPPQYTAPVQPEAPKYEPPVQPEESIYIQPEAPKYTAPEPEPEYDEPEPDPEPEAEYEEEYTAPSRPKAIYAKYENDAQADLDMDAPPIVGNYTIPAQPVSQDGAKTKKASGQKIAANKKAKQSSGMSGRLPMIIGIAAGAVAVIAVIVFVIVKVAGGTGGTNVKGKGNALKELIEMKADSSYSSDEDVFNIDEDYGYDVEEYDDGPEDEAPGEVSSGGEQLYQGWFYATLPEGYIPEREGVENEFMNENNNDQVIKLFLCKVSNDKPSARGAAEADVKWWMENKGEDCGYEIVEDVTIGDYTWVTEHFPWDGGKTSVDLYTDLDDEHYMYASCFTMDENHEDVQAFIKSIRLADGDPYENYNAWKQAKWANED